MGNNREVWQAPPSGGWGAAIQRTQYYPSGLPWAEGTGASVQNKKYNGKEWIEAHGLDVTDLGNRGLYHATNRFTTMDRFAEKYPWQSPYVFAGNNPILNIDIQGDSAWSVIRQWNETDQKGFAEYAGNRLKEYEGKKVDCADLALNVLIDYASENGLSLQISTADGASFDSNSDDYNSVRDFKNGYTNDDGKKVDGVLPNVQARDISSNTYTLNKSDAQPGDMIIMTKPFDHIANYSQITPKRELTYGNLSGGRPAPVKTTPYDWSNSTVDDFGRPMIYNPNRKVVHRWKVLKF